MACIITFDVNKLLKCQHKSKLVQRDYLIMQYETVTGIEKRISKFVLGTMTLDTENIDKSFELLDCALSSGINTFDTAHIYNSGKSERTLGKWIKARKIRDKVVIISKGAHPNIDRKRVTPFDISSDLYDSLSRLNSDYIDIYFLHRDDPSQPVAPIVETLNNFYFQGKIKVFGGSNWTMNRIIEANNYAKKHQLIPFSVSSPHFSLAEQVKNPWGEGCVSLTGSTDSKYKERDWYIKNQMPVFAYSSLARGLLSGIVTKNSLKDREQLLDKVCNYAYCYENNFKRLERAEYLAKKKNSTIAQVSLAYVIKQPLNIFPIIGAVNIKEIEADIGALDIELSQDEIAWLNLENI